MGNSTSAPASAWPNCQCDFCTRNRPTSRDSSVSAAESASTAGASSFSSCSEASKSTSSESNDSSSTASSTCCASSPKTAGARPSTCIASPLQTVAGSNHGIIKNHFHGPVNFGSSQDDLEQQRVESMREMAQTVKLLMQSVRETNIELREQRAQLRAQQSESRPPNSWKGRASEGTQTDLAAGNNAMMEQELKSTPPSCPTCALRAAWSDTFTNTAPSSAAGESCDVDARPSDERPPTASFSTQTDHHLEPEQEQEQLSTKIAQDVQECTDAGATAADTLLLRKPCLRDDSDQTCAAAPPPPSPGPPRIRLPPTAAVVEAIARSLPPLPAKRQRAPQTTLPATSERVTLPQEARSQQQQERSPTQQIRKNAVTVARRAFKRREAKRQARILSGQAGPFTASTSGPYDKIEFAEREEEKEAEARPSLPVYMAPAASQDSDADNAIDDMRGQRSKRVEQPQQPKSMLASGSGQESKATSRPICTWTPVLATPAPEADRVVSVHKKEETSRPFSSLWANLAAVVEEADGMRRAAAEKRAALAEWEETHVQPLLNALKDQRSRGETQPSFIKAIGHAQQQVRESTEKAGKAPEKTERLKAGEWWRRVAVLPASKAFAPLSEWVRWENEADEADKAEKLREYRLLEEGQEEEAASLSQYLADLPRYYEMEMLADIAESRMSLADRKAVAENECATLVGSEQEDAEGQENGAVSLLQHAGTLSTYDGDNSSSSPSNVPACLSTLVEDHRTECLCKGCDCDEFGQAGDMEHVEADYAQLVQDSAWAERAMRTDREMMEEQLLEEKEGGEAQEPRAAQELQMRVQWSLLARSYRETKESFAAQERAVKAAIGKCAAEERGEEDNEDIHRLAEGRNVMKEEKADSGLSNDNPGKTRLGETADMQTQPWKFDDGEDAEMYAGSKTSTQIISSEEFLDSLQPTKVDQALEKRVPSEESFDYLLSDEVDEVDEGRQNRFARDDRDRDEWTDESLVECVDADCAA